MARQGGRAATNPSRTIAPALAPKRSSSVPQPPPRVTRSVTKSTTVARSNTRKRTVPMEEDVPSTRPQKNQKKVAHIVHTIPSLSTFANPQQVYNPHPVYNSPGPSQLPLIYSANLDSSTHTNNPPHRWTHSQNWAPTHDTSPHPVPPGPLISSPQLPPYHTSQSHGSQVVVIDADDFSDGEEVELEAAEDFSGEKDESHAIQFHPPQDVLQNHWHRNGPPPCTQLQPPLSTRPAYPPSTQQVQHIQPTIVRPAQLAPVQPVQTPLQSLSVSQMVPTPPAPVNPTIPNQITTTPPTTTPIPPTVQCTYSAPISVPPLVKGVSFPWNDYPKAWQDLIDLTTSFILYDMIFSHPFVPGFPGQLCSREAIAWAHATFNYEFTSVPLCLRSFDEHRENIIKLATKAAQSHRGRFRTTVLNILYKTKSLGITPKATQTAVAENVGNLLFQNRFLDAKHVVGDDRPSDVMYRSPVIKEAMRILYTTQPWAKTMRLSSHKESRWLLDPPPPGYEELPPISFIAFVATTYRNVLDSLVSGTEQLVDFSESTYCPVYNLLYEQISTDYNHPTYGETVRERIEDLIYDIKFSDIPR